jgi:hypothetical protein
MCESDSISCPENTKQPRWDRTTATAEVFAFEAAPQRAISQRQFAQEHGVPRSTLQHWLARKATIDADPALVAIFESPVGLAFLHRLVVVAHLVFTNVGPCGVRLVCQFLELSVLDRFAAASYGAQQQVSQAMQAEISVFGAQERLRLAQTMSPKKITVCEDEPFHPEVCLVAIEPVSDFIWSKNMPSIVTPRPGIKRSSRPREGLPVEVIQSTGDEAKGILSHVRDGLGAHPRSFCDCQVYTPVYVI